MASELRPTVIFNLCVKMALAPRGYRFSSIVVCNFASILNFYRDLWVLKKRGLQ